MADATSPITPARFAAAIRELPVDSLSIKVKELELSILRLEYSNEEMRPFADGTAEGLTGPDDVCIEAIQENGVVIQRQRERIALVRTEVEARGLNWAEFESSRKTAEARLQEMSEEQIRSGDTAGEARVQEMLKEQTRNGDTGQSSPWTDGTFQTGTISHGMVHMDSQSAETLRNLVNGSTREGESPAAADNGLHL